MTIHTHAFASHWSFPTDVRFGNGRIREIGAAVRALGASSPLVVTDAGLKDLFPVQRALEALREAGLQPGLFFNVKPNPTGRNVADGVEALRSGRHDLVVAIGGGSALDAAKAIALVSSWSCWPGCSTCRYRVRSV